MGDRVVDCARLESVCAERHRGFESPPIRHQWRLGSAPESNNQSNNMTQKEQLVPSVALELANVDC